MGMKKFPSGDASQWKQFFGPGQVDQMIRQAIQMCWMMLPEDKRSVDGVENQMRRIVDRAIKNLREDGDVFRKPPQS